MVPIVLVAPVLNRLTPKADSLERSASANRTFSITCRRRGGCTTCSPLTTSLEKFDAIFSIWSTTAGEETTPTSITLSPCDCASTPLLGNDWSSALRNGLTSRSANTSSMRYWPVSSQSIRLLPPGCLAVTTNSCGEVKTDSMTAGFPVRMRFTREGVRTTTECPTTTCTASELCSPSCDAAAAGCRSVVAAWAIAGACGAGCAAAAGTFALSGACCA